MKLHWTQTTISMFVLLGMLLALNMPGITQAEPPLISSAGILTNGTLTGMVNSAEGPLADVTITARQFIPPYGYYSAQTSLSGIYSISLVPGEYQVHVDKFGWQEQTVEHVLITAGTTTTLDFTLIARPAVMVSGTVKDGSGHGYPLYAYVVFMGTDYVTSTYTDPFDGSYSVELEEGVPYSIHIRSGQASEIDPWYAQVKSYDNVVFNESAVTRNFTLEVLGNMGCYEPGYQHDYFYFQNFESNDGSFTASGNNSSWAWGEPSLSAGPSGGHNSLHTWATNLEGNYNNNESSQLVSPEIDLSSLAGKSVVLEWWQWVQVELNHDHVYVDASKDGGETWNQLYTYTGTTDYTRDLRLAGAELGPTYAVANFKVRFRLVSDGSSTYPGFYIDDVGIGAMSALNEDFEGEVFPPRDWKAFGPSQSGWETSTELSHSQSTSAVHLSTQDSQADDWLVTPMIRLPAGATSLTFWEYTANPGQYQGHYGWVCNFSDLSFCNNPPYSYTRVAEFGAPEAGWRQQTVDLNGYSSSTLTRFAFQYTGENGDDWFIDDVSVSRTEALSPMPCLPVPGGLVAGFVTSAETGEPFNNVLINSDTHAYNRSYVNGFYELFQPAPPSGHTVTAVGPTGYGSLILPVTVANDNVTRLDFAISANPLSAIPIALTANAFPDSLPVHRTLTLHNSGTATLNINLQEYQNTQPVDVPWLSESLSTAPILPGGDLLVDVTFDFSMIHTPETDQAVLQIGQDSGFPAVQVVGSLTAEPGPLVSNIAATQDRITFYWSGRSTVADGFRIERSPDGISAWAVIADLDAEGGTFDDYDVTCESTWYYRVQGYNSGGASPYSNIAHATTTGCPPAAPGNLTAEPVSESALHLHWIDNSDDEYQFIVERSLDGISDWNRIGAVWADIEDFTDHYLACGTTYFYRIYAVGVTGWSDYSNIAGGETGACTIPAPPSHLVAVEEQSTVISLWWFDNSDNESGFKIERSPTGENEWLEIAMMGVDADVYWDEGLICGEGYSYRVRAFNSAGDSEYSNIASQMIPCLPAAPTGLEITDFSPSIIEIHWSDNSYDEVGFDISSSPDGLTDWWLISQVGPNVQKYEDTGLPCGTEFFYQVFAYNISGRSASNIAHGITAPCGLYSPTSLHVIGVGQTSVSLGWTDASDNEEGFIVERSQDGLTGWSDAGTVGASVSNFTDTGLLVGKNYFYRVRAYNGDGNSGHSNTTHASTLLLKFWLTFIANSNH
jgi:hypothetical protein